MPCARVPETRLSTPGGAPGRPPVATPIIPVENLKGIKNKKNTQREQFNSHSHLGI